MFGTIGLLFFREIILFVLRCQGDNLLAEVFQLTSFLSQLVKEGEGFLLTIDSVDALHTLVIVIPDASELLIESGQLSVILLRFLVNPHHPELPSKYAFYCFLFRPRLKKMFYNHLIFSMVTLPLRILLKYCVLTFKSE